MKKPLSEADLLQISIPVGRKRITISDEVCPGLSLELRSSGTASWRFRYTKFGRQRCLSLGLMRNMSLSQARAKCFSIKCQIDSGVDPYALDPRKCPTIQAFINQHYIPHIRTYKRCVWTDQTLLNNHILPRFGHLRMNMIRDVDVSCFIREKMIDGYAKSYCNRFIVLLSFIYNLAIKWEIPGVSKNPCRNVDKFKITCCKERFLSESEAERLMVCINNSQNKLLRYFVPLALLTGARKRELLDAQWSHFDLPKKIWSIPMTKSGKPRYVPLTDQALQVLVNLELFLISLGMRDDLTGNPWLFPNPRTGKPYNTIFKAWNTARNEAGLGDVRIHDLRHSFASALVNKGVPIYDVQKLLGHSNIKTTERYAHLAPDRLRESASVIGKQYSFEFNDENCV